MLEVNLTLIIALSLGLPLNALTEKQPVYTPREDLTPDPRHNPSNFRLMDMSPPHFGSQWGVHTPHHTTGC